MTLLGKTTRRPDISFFRNGRIDITARLAKEINLQPGDVIDIAVEGDEYLLHVRHKAQEVIGRHEAQCFPTNKWPKRTHNLRAHSKRLAEAVLDICGSDNARLNAGQPCQHPALGVAIPIIIRKMST